MSPIMILNANRHSREEPLVVKVQARKPELLLQYHCKITAGHGVAWRCRCIKKEHPIYRYMLSRWAGTL